ncbi:MAG TPA: acyl-CoA dehydrogenase [Actinobacteria bacterium]|nr:acyl-CoA dehydrogenase [Actinomycetota bacterium]
MTAADSGVDVDGYRRGARAWIQTNVPRLGEEGQADATGDRIMLARQIQQQIFDAGYAGITWPKEYGGQELTPAHMHAFTDELAGFVNPYRLLSVSLGVVGPTILQFGTEEQKAQYLPGLLRADALWVQFLSEPSGGSDMAGVLTRATRDGDVWFLNGSKVWTTFGNYADYGLCLVRSNWDVPKHAGLSMFILPVDAPGVTVRQLAQASGESEFCEEFFDNVQLTPAHLLGLEGDGWTVASQLLVHERNALGGGSAFFTEGGGAQQESVIDTEVLDVAAQAGRERDPIARQLVAEMHAASVVREQLGDRVATGMRTGALQGPAGSLLKLYSAELHLRRMQVMRELAGAASVAWEPDDNQTEANAMGWLVRQGQAILGGTNEIQRNIISERVLGLPREYAPDKGVPFTEVRTNSNSRPNDGERS